MSGAERHRFGKKQTVENSYVVPISAIRQWLVPGAVASTSWTGDFGLTCFSITVLVGDIHADEPIWLDYGGRDVPRLKIPVYLQTTPAHFGGQRWWFTCPLLVRGVACNRRVAKLYLPPGAKYFGCRHCHDLTYVSSQWAHFEERLMKSWGETL